MLNKNNIDNTSGLIVTENEELLRPVKDINATKHIINILNKKEMLGFDVVDTEIYSDKENLLKHKIIFPIINSGEFTISQAYDVTEKAINMAIDLSKENIYSYDTLPNNYTFSDGKWILFDFGAFELSSKSVKTLIRGMFQSSFSAFELNKIIERKYLKHYFLNRIKTKYLNKIFPKYFFKPFFFEFIFCMILNYLNLKKLSYRFLNTIFKRYKNEFKRETGEYSSSTNEKEIWAITEKYISYEENNNFLFIGNNAINIAICDTSSKFNKFLYMDDYDECDRVYNYIISNHLNSISVAVIAPLVKNEAISQQYNYRAIYDPYAQERFFCENVLVSNFEELISVDNSIENICQNLIKFSSNNLFILTNNYENDVIKYLENKFESVTVENTAKNKIIIAKNKQDKTFKIDNSINYNNGNRGRESKSHSEEIIKILNSKKTQ